MAGDAAGDASRERRTRYALQGIPEQRLMVSPNVARGYCCWY
ncbi:unnamed protein product [Staurois parvus]|uniref:Uncharacterized protein n=1 Tax=Staurois parvus TaxID=386267 RepID=A0ABN9DTZ8_9NEOB|nr:unnamed protein product [Staurois parvus]